MDLTEWAGRKKSDFFSNLAHRIKPKDGVRNSDGVLVCPVCGQPKEKYMAGFDAPLPVICDCQKKEYRKQSEFRRKAEFRNGLRNMWAEDGICITDFTRETFAADDGTLPKTHLDLAQRYIERWEDMRRLNSGILMYGPVGTGKSYLAHAIANALIEQEVRVCCTTMNRLIELYGKRTFDTSRLKVYDLLVIDDLGAERNTSFADEAVFAVIDSRYTKRLPTIITTNQDKEDLINPENTSSAANRAYDRIVEMCPISLQFEGESKRKENARHTENEIKEILYA